MKRAAFVAAAVALLYAAPLRARTPEIAVDPVNGIWIAQDDKFIFQTIDRWTVFSAGATVNKLVVDQNILWIATDDGVIRFETGSQRSTKLTMDDGLPSQRVSTVAFDDQYVWFGTNKGLVRYRKTDRTLKLYDESNGLPSKTVTYSVTIGRQVWFGTRAGIAVFSPDVDGLRAFGEADGMASGDVAEVFQVGSDLWCRTDIGLSRFRIQQRVFNNFPMTMMGAQQLRVMAVDGADIWLGTDNGLFQFQDASDSIIPFPLQAALGSKMIVGVEPTSSYVYITTDREILQYSRTSMAIRRWTSAEGLLHQEGSTGTLTQGGFFTVLFPDTAEMYNIQLDQWTERKIEVKAASASRTTARVYGQLDSEMPYKNVHLGPGWGLHGTPDTENQYANATGGFGFGQQLDKDRTLNGSVYLDYGQLNASGIRDLQYKIEYLGNQNDVVRDVRVEDKLKYRYVEEGLERQLLLQGAHVGMATPGAEPKASMSIDAGFRRGQVVRDFITGPRQDTYQLSQKYILPGTDRVYVDGELLNNGTDYTIVYTAGQLLFLNPERVDDLSVITVEYEHDLVPKKDLGTLSLSSRLPVTNEIGNWALSGTPAIISNDTALYSQIDGGAPKYIDRGWISSVYAVYQQGGSSIQVQIHNMGTPENAQAIYQFDLPVSRLALNTLPDGTVNAVVDMGQSSSYQAEAVVDQYVIEANIDDRSDAALAYIKTFTMEILNRSKQAGASLGDQFKEWMVATRVAASPVHGMEIGARAVELQQMDDTRDANGNLVSPALHLTSGALDGRYQTKVGEGGLVTGYAEMAGSHDSTGPRPDGLAGMGFLRLSSPTLEGTLSGRLNSEGWTPVGHTTPTSVEPSTRTWNDARLGTLRDETRFNVTGYPVAWLPVTALFTRQRAWLPDGSEGTGVLQHAIARVQLNKAGLPGTTLQLSSTELDNPNGFQTHRLQGSLQTDYDLAPALSFTHIKKFNIRALYSLSQGETDENGTYAYEDRVRLMRFEGKLSPTATESIYALYRSRDVGRQSDSGGPFWRSLYHWELTSGAQSRIIRGLVPQLNYNLIYDDNRLPGSSQNGTTGTGTTTTSSTTATSASLGGLSVNQWSNTGPAGSAITPVGPGPMTIQAPTVTVTGSIGAGLGIYPGQWWAKLAPLALSPSVAVGDSEQTAAGVKTTYSRIYDFVVMEVWGGRRLEMQLYQRYRITTTEDIAQPDPHESASTTILQNRIVYRPIFTSPITLLLNYGHDRGLNNPAVLGNAGLWWDKETYQTTLQWLMRWGDKLTTRTTATGTLERTSDYFTQEGTSNVYLSADHSKYSAYGEFQFRIYPLPEVSALYIYQTTGVTRWFGSGAGAFEAWELLPAGGAIWRVGDKMYLDAQFSYDYLYCMSGTACTPVSRILPHLYFTMNL
jgi:hypothetical protein